MKQYITQFFNKPADEITLADIETFFSTRQEENSTLEFKSGQVEISDVFKEISAFLNTEGGLLIIGSPEESKEIVGKRNVRFCIGKLTYSKFISKDWLHQKIFSNITPSPTNIFIKEISTPNGNIFIIDIPQSLQPPHQSNSDGRYYIRIDNEAKPAPHGLIQALFNKRKVPKLSADIILDQTHFDTDSLFVALKNNSAIPAEKVGFIIDVYNAEVPDNFQGFRHITKDELGIKFSYSGNTDQVLVSVMSLGIEFAVHHNEKKYIVMVSYWCKDTDFDATIFTINPEEKSIESVGWLDEGVKISDLIKDLQK